MSFRYSELPTSEPEDEERGLVQLTAAKESSLEDVLKHAQRMESLSLQISNEIDTQNREWQALDDEMDSMDVEAESLSAKARLAAASADREATVWCWIVVVLLIAVLVAILVKFVIA